MAQGYRHETPGTGQRRFKWLDTDSRPSWRNHGTGRAMLDVATHPDNPYLSFVAREISEDGKAQKETMVTLNPEMAKALMQWLLANFTGA